MEMLCIAPQIVLELVAMPVQGMVVLRLVPWSISRRVKGK